MKYKINKEQLYLFTVKDHVYNQLQGDFNYQTSYNVLHFIKTDVYEDLETHLYWQYTIPLQRVWFYEI